MVPPDITIWQAAAPRASQLFVLVGASVLIPLILIYSGFSYWVFRGKVQAGAHYHRLRLRLWVAERMAA